MLVGGGLLVLCGPLMNWFWVFCLLRHSSALQFRDFTLDEIEDQAKGLIGRFADVKTASELWGDEMVSPLLCRRIMFLEKPKVHSSHRSSYGS